ncbi:MAG: metallophosphoesterase [Bacteroidetes bacterium]|nr:MAG: metallophosphoesterase [Bacteroidota bacterium]
MNYTRKQFIKSVSAAGTLLLAGGFVSLSAAEVFERRKKVRLRFIVASDGHYGQPQTPFDNYFNTFTEQANNFHSENPVDFCVINGDIIHDKPDFLDKAKTKIDNLVMPYYVTRGNHDMVSAANWNAVWNMALNHHAVVKNTALILADCSNEQGKYLSPDLEWMKKQLDKSYKLKNVFIFVHIPQAKWTANAIDTPQFFELLKAYKNIRCVFHGHEHDQDGVRIHNGIPFLFDAHIGGNWGTSYKGFRVVEIVNDNEVITYMMNPIDRTNEATY